MSKEIVSLISSIGLVLDDLNIMFKRLGLRNEYLQFVESYCDYYDGIRDNLQACDFPLLYDTDGKDFMKALVLVAVAVVETDNIPINMFRKIIRSYFFALVVDRESDRPILKMMINKLVDGAK